MLPKSTSFFNFVLSSQNFLSQSIAYKDDLGGDFSIHFFTLKGQRISSPKIAQYWEQFFSQKRLWKQELVSKNRITANFYFFSIISGRERRVDFS